MVNLVFLWGMFAPRTTKDRAAYLCMHHGQVVASPHRRFVRRWLKLVLHPAYASCVQLSEMQKFYSCRLPCASVRALRPLRPSYFAFNIVFVPPVLRLCARVITHVFSFGVSVFNVSVLIHVWFGCPYCNVLGTPYKEWTNFCGWTFITLLAKDNTVRVQGGKTTHGGKMTFALFSQVS